MKGQAYGCGLEAGPAVVGKCNRWMAVQFVHEYMKEIGHGTLARTASQVR